MHRSQGATCERAHVYEDGGGRELAYVAMSRAREHTHLYVAADDLAQAKEDLQRAWASERRWRWAIDTGTPEIDGPEINGPEINGPEINGPEINGQEVEARSLLPCAARPWWPNGPPKPRFRWTGPKNDARPPPSGRRCRQLDRLHLDQGRTSGGELGRSAGGCPRPPTPPRQ